MKFKEGENLLRGNCYSAACSRSHFSTLFDLDCTWNFANESRNVVSGNSFDRLLNLGLEIQNNHLLRHLAMM